MKYLDFERIEAIDPRRCHATRPYPWINPSDLISSAGFESLVDTLQLTPHVTVRPPACFEGDAYAARFTFGSPVDLQRIGRRLLEAADDPSADELRSLLTDGLAEDEEGGAA